MLKVRLAASRRLATYLATAGVAVLAAGLFCAYLLTVYLENRAVYRLVQQRADVVAHALTEGLPVPSEIGYVIRADYARDPLPPRLERLGIGYHLIGESDEIEHVVVREVAGGRVYAVYRDAIHRQKLATLMRLLTGIFVALGACIVVLSYWWANQMIGLRPGAQRRVNRALAGGRDAASALDTHANLSLAYAEYRDTLMGHHQREREFIANVGHELRTPITLILTGCELLSDKEGLDPVASRQLSRIRQAAEHMNETVRGFMILARDGSLGEPDYVEIRACVLEALEPHQAHIEQTGLNVTINVGVDAMLQANREAVFVVISNLINNAIKYTSQGGISIRHLGNTLYVSDTGYGIHDGDLPKLFLPFFRAQATAELGVQGLGLGLAIVKRICDYYGWSITVRSRLGQGSTFSIEFTQST